MSELLKLKYKLFLFHLILFFFSLGSFAAYSSLFDELNTMFFCSTRPLKAPNRLKPLKLD
jgi:hypothetical protein